MLQQRVRAIIPCSIETNYKTRILKFQDTLYTIDEIDERLKTNDNYF